jgi:hypothetical protein
MPVSGFSRIPEVEFIIDPEFPQDGDISLNQRLAFSLAWLPMCGHKFSRKVDVGIYHEF